MFQLGFVDLISASLKLPDKRECDENNNKDGKADVEQPPKSDEVGGDDEKAEKTKPKQMVGLFPLDLRSELKLRVGGKAGFSLKKSSTNVDVFNKNKSDPIPIKLPVLRADKSNDFVRAIQGNSMRRKSKEDSDDEGGQENLSFKEKLQLIERSSSKSLVNPLWVLKIELVQV